MSYSRTGNSDLPIVLFHAMPLSATEWRPVLGLLDGLDVITVDAPGFGASPSGKEVSAYFHAPSPALDTYVQGTLEILRAEHVQHAVLAGNSMGGTLALNVAATVPEVTAAIGVFSSSIDPDPDPAPRAALIEKIRREGAWSVLEGWLNTMITPADPPALRTSLEQEFRTVSDTAFAWVQEAMAHRHSGAPALALSAPTLLVRGAKDPQTTHEDYAARAAANANTRLVEIPDAAHFTPLEQPAEVARLLRELFVAARG